MDQVGSPPPLTEKRRGPSSWMLRLRLGAMYLLVAEQEQRPGRQGLRAGAELRMRAVLQDQEKLLGSRFNVNLGW